VEVNARPTITASSDATICSNVSTTISVSGDALTYDWDNNVSGSSQFVNPQDTTTYTVTGSYGNGCSSTDAVTVNVLPAPVANAGADFDINYSTNGQLNGSATGGTGSYMYSWSPVDSLDDASLANPTVSNV